MEKTEKQKKRAEYYAANKEREKKAIKEYLSDPANRAKRNATRKTWREGHADKVKSWQKLHGGKAKGIRRAEYNAMKEKIGCMNPGCDWKGPYKACLLDFVTVHGDSATAWQ